ncbi:hypothetical protein JKF63_05891 [Porcisia hertigi]|uniref:Uncharacterized protein n=1 Tax=Porcisia hertigi TaxID=2761500 RepID=A0A836IQL6_9TRYP|nr:hypothetical protein JKF63_05891 [Porcisia hertigi]
MVPSVLGKVASQAVRLFARNKAPRPHAFPSSPPPPSLVSSTSPDLSDLVSCTRSLIVLTRLCGSGAAGAHLLRCLRECANATLDTLTFLPYRAHIPADVCVVLLVILRSAAGFWQEDKCTALAQLLGEHVDPVVLQTWKPNILVATVHAFAKACPSQAELPLVTDCLVRLRQCEAQLAAQDVAAALWSIATLQLCESQLPLWGSLCRKAALLFSSMNRVSRLTVTQALLLQPLHLCESQAELLRVAHVEGMESTECISLGGDRRAGGGWRTRSPRHRGSSNSVSCASSRAGGRDLTSELLQCTTHALTDESLVRLLIILFEKSEEATKEMRLVVAHLTLRGSLSDRLCLQLLDFTQPRCETVALSLADLAVERPSARVPLPAEHSETSVLLRKARQHALRQLILGLRKGVVPSPRHALEALCVEHYSVCSRPALESQPPSSGTADSAESAEVVWAAIVKVFSDASKDSARDFHFVSGEELLGWHCIAAYLRAVIAAGDVPTCDVPEVLGATLGAFEQHLSATTHPRRYWLNNRERNARCAEVVVAARHYRRSHLLNYCAAAGLANATVFVLLSECVRDLVGSSAALTVPTTLRLLSAVDEAPAVVAPHVQPLKPFLLSQLETQITRASGMLPDLVQYLTSTLPRSLAVWQAPSRVRVSDAVLDLYLRLLTREPPRALSALQSELLVRCLEERRMSAAALEDAFMMLITRRLGQTASFLSTVKLPVCALSRLVELARTLPRGKDASTTATATTILSTLLDVLIQQAIPACGTAEELIAGAVTLCDQAVADMQRTSALAAAVQAKGSSLLRSTGVTWSPVQKAYLIAALVCVKVDPTPELLHALREEGETPAEGIV